MDFRRRQKTLVARVLMSTDGAPYRLCLSASIPVWHSHPRLCSKFFLFPALLCVSVFPWWTLVFNFGTFGPALRERFWQFSNWLPRSLSPVAYSLLYSSSAPEVIRARLLAGPNKVRIKSGFKRSILRRKIPLSWSLIRPALELSHA